MTSTGRFGGHGVRFDITSSDTDVVATFEDLLADMRHQRPGGSAAPGADHRIDIEPVRDVTDDVGPRFRVQFDGRTMYDTLAEGSVVSHVLMEINQRVAAAVWSTTAIPLHASTVTRPPGAIVLAGASHSGKTTLAAALAIARPNEVEFLADEVSALHPTDLTIAPYGKPAALRTPGLDLLVPNVTRLQHRGSRFETDERFVPPSELGASRSAPARVVAIVFPRFDATTLGSATDIDVVSPIEALTRLMRLTLGNAPIDISTFRALERLVRGVAAFEIVYADAIEAADQLSAVSSGPPST